MNNEELDAVKAFNIVSMFIQRNSGSGDKSMRALIEVSEMIKACVGQRIIAEKMKEKQ
jgi:hypothetical protein